MFKKILIADRGETDITMAEIREWLANLPPPRGQEGPDVEAPTEIGSGSIGRILVPIEQCTQNFSINRF